MRKDDAVHPREHTFMALLKACTKSKDSEKGFEVHAELDRTGLLNTNVFVGSALVDMYVKCGLLAKAQEVFDKMPFRNVVSWTALIAGYVDHGHGEEALKCLEHMQIQGVSPNAVTLLCGLKACGILRAIKKGWELHAEIERQGLAQRDLVVGNTLVDMYVKCGMLVEAKQVFEKLPVRDVVSWTALIAGYVEHGNGQEALECFNRMQLEGVSPNCVTLVCSLKACGSIGATDEGRKIHAEIERQELLERDHVVGNALVNMYARCGFLNDAQQVLDKLPFRDVVSWTSLIARYVECGHGEKALECYERMQHEGVSPNAATFVCMLNACGLVGATSEGRAIHCEIERRGFAGRDIVSKSLIEMYVNFSFLAVAQEVLDKVHVQSITLWNTLIAGYAEHGHDDEALQCLELMQLEGISMDAVTCVCGLKACGSLGAVNKGQDIHSEVERRGLLDDRDLVMGNALVDMYAKCGSLHLSQEVFNSLPTRNVVTWTALIAGYTEHGQGEEAIKCFDLMQLRSVAPNATTFVCSLKACGSIQAEEKGREIHVEVERQGLSEQNLIVGNALVDMYVKCGLLITAQEVFDKLPDRDVVSWTSLIMGYAEHGHGEEALKCFKQMQLDGVSSDAVAFICSLKACGSIKATDEGQDIHAKIKGHRLLEEDLVIGSTLVDMYAKCGSLALAQEVFDNVFLRDQVLWNSLIGGYVEHGNCDEALNCFKQLRHEAVLPNAETFVLCLKACAILGAIVEGQKLHVEIERQRLSESNVYVGSSLVDMYAKCGSFALAQQVFEKLSVQNVVSWTALIAGYEEHGHSEEALQCFDSMRLKGVSMNAVTYVSVLKACGSIGAMDKGEEIHAEIERQGLLEGDLVVGNALVDMYMKCGSLEKAQHVFDTLSIRNVVSWTTLLGGYAELGESAHVLNNFDRMIKDGIMPNSVTFAIILSACNRAGLFNESHMFLERMSKEYGIVPTVEHFTWVIDVLCRAGKLDKAVTMINKMPFCPNPMVWHTLLNACEKWGSVELGKEAFEHAKRLDEKDTEAFVFMSHIYASSGFQAQGNTV